MTMGAHPTGVRIMGTVMALMGMVITGTAITVMVIMDMARRRPISRAPSPWESC
jgi:hypothetical protein